MTQPSPPPESTSETWSDPPPVTRPAATARRRAAAYLLDAALLGPPLLLALVVGARRDRPRRTALLAFVAINLYHVVFEGTTGRTPGKRAVGVRVVREDGAPCTAWPATVRTLARVLDFLPVGYLAAFVAMARSPRRRRLGDLLAGTVVIEEGEDP